VSEGARSARAILDDTSRGQMPQPYLLDTRRPADSAVMQAARKPAPLRLIKQAEPAKVCEGITCRLSPGCTAKCRYREAAEAIGGHYNGRHTQRQAMPEVTPTSPRTPEDLRARALAWRGLFVVATLTACALGYALWQTLG
jgi:hypothetical protein